MTRLHYICAKILIIEPKLSFERAKITKLKKNDKKIAKMFGGFAKSAYLCNRKSEMTRTLLQ